VTVPCPDWHGIVTRPSSVREARSVRLRIVRWGRKHHELEVQLAPAADPLVWEGRLPVVTSPPVRIAARRAADLAAEAPLPASSSAPLATPDAA
jgi:hypothetical protein